MNVTKPKTVAENLEAGLAQAVEVGECLEWQGFFACKGVTPVVKARNMEKGQTENHSVPRLVWERAHGPIPAGKLIYRTCCNCNCVLLEHLAMGTRKDMFRARRKQGVNVHKQATILSITVAARRRASTKYSMDKAREVRSLKAAGLRHVDIAAQSGVSLAMVDDMVSGKSWRELGSPFAGLGERRAA